MKAQIKRLHSPDIYDLENFIPERRNNFSFLLQVIVGEKDKQGEESFDILVFTPQYLLANNTTNEIIWGRNSLIVFEYNYHIIHDKLKNYIEQLEENTWNQLAEKISRIGKWEFEDYNSKK